MADVQGYQDVPCDTTDEPSNMIRDLGNLRNTVASLQKSLTFIDKIRQIHVYLVNNLIVDNTGKSAVDNKDQAFPY